MRNFSAFLIFLFVISAGKLFSQTDSLPKPVKQKKLCEVNLTDGSSYKGYILKQTDSLIYLKSSAGVVIHIPKNSVAGINFHRGGIVSGDSIGGIHSQSIGHNYYVANSNAFLFHEKKFYGSTSYFVLYNINYAFGHHFSAGISTTPILTPLSLNLKANFEISPKVYFGAEAVAGKMSYINPRTYGIGGVLKLTLGKEEEKNYTFYAGYGDVEYWLKPNKKNQSQPANFYRGYYSPFAGVALSVPFTHMRNTNFTSEVFVFPNISIYSISAGMRTNHKQKVSFVFGLQYIGLNYARLRNIPLPNFLALPYIGFSFRV